MTNETSTRDLFAEVADLLDNKLTFNFKSAGVQKTIELLELPVETLAVLLDYGTRKLNDTVNSMYASDKNEKSREELVAEVWKRAIEGNLGERRNTNAGFAGLRNYILQFAKARGVKADKLKELKGATPAAVVMALYPKKTPEEQGTILNTFSTKYEESLKAQDDLDIEF